MSDNMPKPTATTAATAPPGGAAKHPYPPHANDMVAVEIVFPGGGRWNGRTYRQGETLVMGRGYAQRHNKPDKAVLRILGTVRYHNGPADQAEEALPEGPVDLGGA